TITGNAPLNLNGSTGSTNGSTFQINAKGSPTVHSVGAITMANSNSAALMSLGGNNTLNATALTIPAASKMTVSGGGSLMVSGVGSIGDNAKLTYGTNATHITHLIGGLQISTNGGLVDLGNSALLTDNTQTTEAQVRQYLHNGYNPDASGNGTWP